MCEGAGSVTVCVKLESAIEKDVVALVETSDGSFAKGILMLENYFIYVRVTGNIQQSLSSIACMHKFIHMSDCTCTK